MQQNQDERVATRTGLENVGSPSESFPHTPNSSNDAEFPEDGGHEADTKRRLSSKLLATARWRERTRIWKVLGLMAFAVAVLAYCTACAIIPDSAYIAPYPDRLLKDADPWITSIQYLPDAELQAECKRAPVRVHGCAHLLTGEIFILDAYGPAFKDCVLRHELSHFYDVYVRHIGVSETQEHKDWFEQYCYPVRAAGGVSLVAR
jgi:hypothetical protein